MSFKEECERAMCFVDRAKYSNSEEGFHWVFECAIDSCSSRKFYLSGYPKAMLYSKKRNLFGSLQKMMDHLYFAHCGKPYKCGVCELFFVCVEDLQTHFVVYHPGSSMMQEDFGYPNLTVEDCNKANWLFVNFVKKFTVPTILSFPCLVEDDTVPVAPIYSGSVTVGAVPVSPISDSGSVTSTSPVGDEQCGQSGNDTQKFSRKKGGELLDSLKDCFEIQNNAFVQLLGEMPNTVEEYVIKSDHFTEMMIRIQDGVFAQLKDFMGIQNDSDPNGTAGNSSSLSATAPLINL